MPGKEIKGRSKRANYRHGGRTGFKHGKYVKVPVPHVDINKYVTKRGKVEGPEGEDTYWRSEREGSLMKIAKKRRPRTGPKAGRPKSS